MASHYRPPIDSMICHLPISRCISLGHPAAKRASLMHVPLIHQYFRGMPRNVDFQGRNVTFFLSKNFVRDTF